VEVALARARKSTIQSLLIDSCGYTQNNTQYTIRQCLRGRPPRVETGLVKGSSQGGARTPNQTKLRWGERMSTPAQAHHAARRAPLLFSQLLNAFSAALTALESPPRKSTRNCRWNEFRLVAVVDAGSTTACSESAGRHPIRKASSPANSSAKPDQASLALSILGRA
jgi:hypothetical protein